MDSNYYRKAVVQERVIGCLMQSCFIPSAVQRYNSSTDQRVNTPG